MKKLILSACLLIFTASAALAGEIIVTFIKGTVEVYRQSPGAWEKARPGMILKAGDKIRTGRRSQTNTLSKEGHRITVKEKTTFEITQLGPKDWEFNQGKGKTRLFVAKLGSGQGLRVRTPTALCGVRGTEFQVTVLDDLSTILDVFSGKVNFGDSRGAIPETPVEENQRSAVEQGAAAPKPPEAIPQKEIQRARDERMRFNQEDKKFNDERGVVGEQGKLPPTEFKKEIEREISRDTFREKIESDAIFQQKVATYQEAKTLVDAFGKLVRLEEYVTRPTPESFKYVALNHRDNRLDHLVFEVTANRPLPPSLDEAGNLWSSIGDRKPDFFVVKQRLFSTNQKDTYEQVNLDGDSKPVTFQEPIFGDQGQFLGVTSQKGYKTVFDHRYEFLNGNPGASERLWTDVSFRPRDNGLLSGTDVRGMMWHMRPVLIEKYDPAASAVTESFWTDVFVTNSGAGATATGKFDFVTHEPDPNPFLAHFTETHNYINFVDANGNGRLDQGERFKDLNGNGTRDINEPFEDVVQMGLSGTPDISRTFNGAGDGKFFSDLNRNSLEDDGTLGFDPLSVSQRPWAWLKNETFMVNNLGQILDTRTIGQNAGSSDSIAQTFEQVNFEKVWTSSEFSGKIDVVATPRILLKSGFLKTKVTGNEPVDQR